MTKQAYTPEEIRRLRAELRIDEQVAQATEAVASLQLDQRSVAHGPSSGELTETNRQYRF